LLVVVVVGALVVLVVGGSVVVADGAIVVVERLVAGTALRLAVFVLFGETAAAITTMTNRAVQAPTPMSALDALFFGGGGGENGWPG
jgi:hypothetical protein